MTQNDKQFVYEFIHKHLIAALACINHSCQPEASIVEFGDTPNLELTFDTLSKSYRKFKNLRNNPAVAFVIGWDDKITVQYEGIAKEITGEEAERYKEIFFEKNPDRARKWDNDPEVKHFLVRPKYIRYSDYDGKPYKIIELKF